MLYFLADFINGPNMKDGSEGKFYMPASRKDVAWCTLVLKDFRPEDASIYGNWLVRRDYDKLNITWRRIVEELKGNRLEKCFLAKCSTLFYNPLCVDPGPSTAGVICVYTYKDDMEAVGYKLIQIVKQDIEYKTDEDTLNSHMGKNSIKTLYYNQGSPSFELNGERCYGTTEKKEDKWQINRVYPERGSKYGRWVIVLRYTELTRMWHTLKRKIESGKMNALKMDSPSTRSSDGSPLFYVYTTRKEMKNVGDVLIAVVCRDIKFEKRSKSKYRQSITMYWNQGDFSFVKVIGK